MQKIKYIRYAIRGKGTDKEKKIKLNNPIKIYYSNALKQWVSIPDDE